MTDDARPRKKKRAKCQKCGAEVLADGPDPKGVYRAECGECGHLTLFKAKDDEREKPEPRPVQDTRNDETSPLARRPAAAPPGSPHFKGTKTRSDDEQPGYDPPEADRIARGRTIPDDREPQRGLDARPPRPTGIAGALADVAELARISIDLVRRAWLPALVSTLVYGGVAALVIGLVLLLMASMLRGSGGAGACILIPVILILGLPCLALVNVGFLASFGLAVHGKRPAIGEAIGHAGRRIGRLILVYLVLFIAMAGVTFTLSLCLGAVLAPLRSAMAAVAVAGVSTLVFGAVVVFLQAILLVLPQAASFVEEPAGLTPPYGRAQALGKGRLPLLLLVALAPTLIGLLVHPSVIGKAAAQEALGTNLPVLEAVMAGVGWILSFAVQDLLSIAAYGVCAGIGPHDD